ncbi:hypothetical protein ACQGR0_11150 [Bacillus sp. GMa5/2]
MQAISKTRKFEVMFEMLEKGDTATLLFTVAGITSKWVLQVDKAAPSAF